MLENEIVYGQCREILNVVPVMFACVTGHVLLRLLVGVPLCLWFLFLCDIRMDPFCSGWPVTEYSSKLDEALTRIISYTDTLRLNIQMFVVSRDIVRRKITKTLYWLLYISAVTGICLYYIAC